MYNVPYVFFSTGFSDNIIYWYIYNYVFHIMCQFVI